MGVLFRFRLPDELVERYPIFVETGTGLGVSLSYAAEHKFKRLVSIEYDERLADKARQRFSDDARVRIVSGASSETLGPLLRSYREVPGFLFWLDAHWPGSDYFGEPYTVGDNRELSVPLGFELQAIADTWEVHKGKFIAVIDDISSLMVHERGAPYLFEAFSETHDTLLYMKDEGYAVISPKGDGPRPELIDKYDIHQLTAAAGRYLRHDHWSGAAGFCSQIIALTDGGIDPPDKLEKMVGRADAFRYFADDAIAKRSPGSASDLFIQAIGADPLNLDYRIDYIAKVLLPVGWRELALKEAKTAVKIFPDEPMPWLALVEVNRRLGKREDAITAMAEARKKTGVTRKPIELLDAELSADLGDFAASSRSYDQVLTQYPTFRGEALVGLGVAQARDGQFEAAIASFDQALDVGAPDEALTKWNRAEVLLTLGRYAEGWPDHGRRFELELKVPGMSGASSRFRRPMLTPDTPPCRVHVQGEQGFGDVIAMARYTQMLVSLGHEVQFEVDPKLVDLLSYSLPGVRVVPLALDFPGWLGLDKWGDFDAILPCMCFPAFFGTTIDTVPWNGPYLRSFWRLKCQECDGIGGRCTECDGRGFFELDSVNHPLERRRGSRPKVGLCWSSGRRDGIWEDEYCRQKSVPYHEVGKLINALGERVDWHLFDFPNDMMVRDDKGQTFADTAAMLANCDLLITCDTAMAHLGGAMGVPTWIMMHGPAGSWHWMTARADGGRWIEKSPWYPSVKLFRQERPHEWTGVIDRIADALRKKLL